MNDFFDLPHPPAAGNDRPAVEPTPVTEPTAVPEPAPVTEPTPIVGSAAVGEPAAAEPLPTPEEPPAPAAPVPPPPLPPPAPAYRWSYADQRVHDTAAPSKNKRGILLGACIMTGVFLVSFALLIAVLLAGNHGGTALLRPGIREELDHEAVEGVEQAKHSVVVIETKNPGGGGTGTGIIMTADGYIATNHHVIEGATEIKVTFYDGSVAVAELIGSSEMDDLAVIKVARLGLTPATFGYSEECYVGQTVYAIGTPAGPEFCWTTTRGIISYKDREVKIYNDDDGTLQKKLRLLQTDANVNPGNSGGPLINTKGEVIGVVSMKLAEGYEGIGFAIPSDGAVEILEAIMEGRLDDINSSLSHKRPMLGIVCVSVEADRYYISHGDRIERIEEEDLPDYADVQVIHPAVSGVLVMDITDGMDAVGKIQPGDIITAVEGETVTTGDELTHIINDYYAGDTVTITVYRGSIYSSVDIVLSAKPD